MARTRFERPIEVAMVETDPYLLGRVPAEEQRLIQQAADLEGEARWLLDQLDIRPGARAVDLGCGPRGGIVGLLSEHVGPNGTVIGIDNSERFVALSRTYVAEQGLTNVEVRRADASATGLPRNWFDIAHMRLVLVNVPAPESFVEEMVALVRPGGMIASHEADLITHICDPPSSAWDRLIEIHTAHARAHGIDLFIGRRTHRMLADAGLVDVRVKPVVHVYPAGHRRRTILWDFIRNRRDRLVAENFVRDDALHVLLAELKAHLDDDRTLVVSHLFFQVWGRKPQ
jgi:2-polyprenyl-3-methyl-5-hydroxy-6-metoxy-1,4-benzoquinol methylase